MVATPLHSPDDFTLFQQDAREVSIQTLCWFVRGRESKVGEKGRSFVLMKKSTQSAYPASPLYVKGIYLSFHFLIGNGRITTNTINK